MSGDSIGHPTFAVCRRDAHCQTVRSNYFHGESDHSRARQAELPANVNLLRIWILLWLTSVHAPLHCKRSGLSALPLYAKKARVPAGSVRRPNLDRSTAKMSPAIAANFNLGFTRSYLGLSVSVSVRRNEQIPYKLISQIRR